MHILSGSQRKKCFTKIKGVGGRQENMGSRKKDDMKIPGKYIKIGARGQRAKEKEKKEEEEDEY